jgi:AcrR family transcriptional regulator
MENERKQQILAAATRLFRHYGLSKTTVADIAREAGVAVGTVYLEFDSKDAIVAALSGACHSTGLREMRRAASSDGRFAERLRATLDCKVRHFLRVGRDGEHSKELVHCGARAVQQAHAAFRAEEEALLVELLTAARAEREFDVDDPVRVARVLVRTYASFSPPYLYNEDEAQVMALLAATHELVLKGLLKR